MFTLNAKLSREQIILNCREAGERIVRRIWSENLTEDERERLQLQLRNLAMYELEFMEGYDV
jgi:hypothetical protein